MLRANLSPLRLLKSKRLRKERFKRFKSRYFEQAGKLKDEVFISYSYPNYSLRRVLIGKFKRFVRRNNTKHFLKRKLKLKRQRRFFYSVHIAAPRKKNKKKSLFALKHIYYRKISYFFGFKKVSSFFKSYDAARRLWGRNQFAVFLMLEARLDNFLFRLNFLPSIYFTKRFIKNGNVFVNNQKITFDSYLLSFNQIVSLNKRYFKYIYCSLKSRLKKRLVLLNYPDFAEVDYKLLTAMLIRNPTVKSLTRPVSFELYTKYLTYNKY
jgi:ribosomal protein S4